MDSVRGIFFGDRPGKRCERAWLAISARVVLAVAGGYVASAGLVAALSATLHAIGMARNESAVLASMLGFIGCLALAFFAFAVRELGAVAVFIGSLAVGGFGVAWLLGPGS